MVRSLEALRANDTMWSNFKDWLEHLIHQEVKKLEAVDKDGFEHQKGRIAGIRTVLSEATKAEREEKGKDAAGRRGAV